VSTGKKQLLEFWRRSVRLAVGLALAGALALWALWPQDWPAGTGRSLALGLLLGSAAGVARFRLSLGVLLGGPSRAAMVRSRLMGYGVSAAALLVAFLFRSAISPWTCAVGLLVMNAALLLTNWRDQRTGRTAAANQRAAQEPPKENADEPAQQADTTADNTEA
jgi:hypothetical protein